MRSFKPAAGPASHFRTFAPFRGLLVVGALLLWLWGPTASVATTDTQAPPITIQADRLVTFGDKNVAVFSGNVEALQGTTVIRADTLSVHYKGALADPSAASGDQELEEAIERIHAAGNVRIQLDARLGEADEAEYVPQTGIITLTGAPARIRSGPNLITGHKITLYAQTQEIMVERGVKERVEAIFYTTDVLPNAQ